MDFLKLEAFHQQMYNFDLDLCGTFTHNPTTYHFHKHFQKVPQMFFRSPIKESPTTYYLFVCPSVRPSVHPSRMPCPLCHIYSSGWILLILGTNDHYHERVCRAPWPFTLTYIFKVIEPWLCNNTAKICLILSCPLCNVYSSGWILSILGTNDHYHERVCRAPWPFTLTYIFKVIEPWLCNDTAKICLILSCPLCNVYSSGWILSILGTNDHYH